jgi:hypothetical protein
LNTTLDNFYNERLDHHYHDKSYENGVMTIENEDFSSRLSLDAIET